VPSLPTLYRVIKRELGAGRVIEVARPAGACTFPVHRSPASGIVLAEARVTIPRRR
jgi:hypothetical protein